MDICQILGDNLNRIRKEMGLSITAFSETVNVSRSSMQTILNGTGNPRCDTIDHIAKQLNVDVSSLLSVPQAHEQTLSEQIRQELQRILSQFSATEGQHE